MKKAPAADVIYARKRSPCGRQLHRLSILVRNTADHMYSLRFHGFKDQGKILDALVFTCMRTVLRQEEEEANS